MQNIPDKDIDQIIKEAAENQKVLFNPAAWEKMEQKLGKAEKDRTLIKNVRNGLIIFAFLSLTGLILFDNFIKFQQSDAIKTESPSHHSPSENNDENATTAESINDNNYYDGNAKKRDPEANNMAPYSDQNTSIDYKEKEQNTGFISPFVNTNRNEKPSRINKKLFSLYPEIYPLTYTDPVEIKKQTFNLKTIIKSDSSTSRWLSIALNIAPDLSGVGLSSFDQPGSNIGLIIEYNLNNKISFSTGVIYSNKIYRVRKGFKPYEGYWYGKPKPDRVDGTCNVIDIPFNIRYNILSQSKNKFFVSAGLSTYLMLTEDYDFVYKDYSNYPYSKRNENQHYFGIGNISLGYEKFIHPQWSLQIEPFIKLPLTEIGVGNLDLLSTGAFLSIKHHFKKK